MGIDKWLIKRKITIPQFKSFDVSFGIEAIKRLTDTQKGEPKEVEDTFIKCPKCKRAVSKRRVQRRFYTCYECGGYFRIRTNNRIRMVADAGTFEPWFEDIEIKNPLNFEGYEEKLEGIKKESGLNEALTIGKCKVFSEEIVLGICDARFLMGSMGHVVGEKLCLAFERATKERLPVFIFTCSGGARMQEGIVSLMQMAKTSAAIERFGKEGLFYSSILTDPTTGGVTASFAMLGDVIMAEPGALIGFAGPRVIKQTIGEELPEGFQTAEYLVEHGIIDGIVERKNLKKTIYFLVKAHRCKAGEYGAFKTVDYSSHITEAAKEKEHFSYELTAWEKIKAVRSVERAGSLDYIEGIFDYFVEAHGDRSFRDDPAVITGIGFIGEQPITVVATHKGRSLKECKDRNYGMPMPEGYRKAMRIMKQADKFNRPVVCFVNTPGAFPGIEAEERGMGESIARCLYEMAALSVPVICILIGEGGSGGALATAVGNKVWMLENATYSILSPEGFASILWKDSKRAEEASEVMKITAHELKELEIIDEIIPEFGGADDITKSSIASYMRERICKTLIDYNGQDRESIRNERFLRFRKY